MKNIKIKSKVIQITSPSEHVTFALCEDGTVLKMDVGYSIEWKVIEIPAGHLLDIEHERYSEEPINGQDDEDRIYDIKKTIFGILDDYFTISTARKGKEIMNEFIMAKRNKIQR